jgi:hypothetical protein
MLPLAGCICRPHDINHTKNALTYIRVGGGRVLTFNLSKWLT